MAETTHADERDPIDLTIQSVERLYQRITGHTMNPISQTFEPVTSEVNFANLVDARMQQLLLVLNDPSLNQMLRPFSPPIAVWESDDRVLVRIFLAGVKKEDIDISIKGHSLVVSGTRHNTLKDHGFQPRWIEGERGHFQRVISLPQEITAPEISSSLVDGVLEVFIPKTVVSSMATTNTNAKRTKGSNVN